MTVRVLVNALHAKTGGGVTYLRQLLPLLAADPELDVHLLLHPDQSGLYPEPGVTVHLADFRAGFVREMVWEQFRLPGLARRLGIDVTFSPANFGPLLAPGSVVLLRNALEVGRVEKRPAKRLYWATLSAMTFLSLLFCRRAVAVSDYARRSLARLPALARKVAVVHHGVDELFRATPGRPREGFLLAVADLYVQKNLLALVEAVALLRRSRPDAELRIAGSPVDSDYAAQVEARIAQHGLGGAVTLLGPQPKAALADLYRRCAVFVFPSTVETFGQPLAEAMASGAPVACADAAAMPEVLGDAGLYFEPRAPEAIAAAIQRLLDEPALAARLGEAAAARAQRFDWRRCATETAAALKAAAADAPAAPRATSLACGWAWVAGAFLLYLAQFRGLLGPILGRLGLS